MTVLPMNPIILRHKKKATVAAFLRDPIEIFIELFFGIQKSAVAWRQTDFVVGYFLVLLVIF